MFIIKRKNLYISLSLVLMAVSLVLIFVFGLRAGIDFKGGALLEIVYVDARPEIAQVQDAVKSLDINQPLVQPTGDLGYLIKTRDLSEAEHQALVGALSLGGEYQLSEQGFTSIGPSVGRDLARKAVLSIFFVITAIIIFITYAFRRVSKPVPSWKYGIITIITLLHDILIPTGLFALLSYYTGAEVDTLFVLALLTILGLSVHDKIVVFDRIRENLKEKEEGRDKREFRDIVGASTSETIVRSVNITLTTIFVLVPLYLLGPETTKDFALVLSVGLFFGIYSSLFFASPLLVLVEEWQNRKNDKPQTSPN